MSLFNGPTDIGFSPMIGKQRDRPADPKKFQFVSHSDGSTQHFRPVDNTATLYCSTEHRLVTTLQMLKEALSSIMIQINIKKARKSCSSSKMKILIILWWPPWIDYSYVRATCLRRRWPTTGYGEVPSIGPPLPFPKVREGAFVRISNVPEAMFCMMRFIGIARLRSMTRQEKHNHSPD